MTVDGHISTDRGPWVAARIDLDRGGWPVRVDGRPLPTDTRERRFRLPAPPTEVP